MEIVLIVLIFLSLTVAALCLLRLRSVSVREAELSQENAHLQGLILHDELTEARSRRYLTDRVGKTNFEVTNALLYVDLDDFKSVNDGYGHKIGDALLIEISKALIAACRPGDFVTRLGGDEFCVFLADCKIEVARRIADRFSQAVRDAFVMVDDMKVSRSASIGVSDLAPDQDLLDALIQADGALYDAKAKGRNRVSLAAGQDVPSLARPTVEQVVEGLEKDEFGYYVQPIFDLAQKKPVGFEALIRWLKPDGRVLEPEVFMDTITENYHLKLKPPLVAANETAARVTEGGLFCAFNISSSFLRKSARTSGYWVDELLNGLEPKHTVFEIVESAVIENPETASRLIEALQKAGVRIALDDFGVGHSNLERLRQYSVDIVKIDRSFISEIATSERDLGILEGLVAMSKPMGFDIIAEGVETKAQLDALTSIGITQAQGFYLGPPGPARDWMAKITDQS